MTPWVRRVLRVAVIVAVLALLVYALRGMNLQRVWSALGTANVAWLAGSLLCFGAILPLWATEWRVLAPPVATPPWRRMFEVVTMTSSILNTTPMLIGEATGIVLLVAHAGLARAAAVSLLVMDQLLVGVGKLAVLAAAASLVALPLWMTRAIGALVALVGAMFVGLSVAAWRHADLARIARRVMPDRHATTVGALGAALSPLRSPPRAAALLLLALAKKGAEALAIICVQRAFGLSMPAAAVLALATLSLATLVPVVPGDVGVYEGAVVVAYTSQGVPAEQALAMAMVQHACSFVALALPGYWWLVRRPVTDAASTRAARTIR